MAYGPIEDEWFLNRSIWPIDRTLTDSTTLDQSGFGSNGNQGVFWTLQSWILSIRYSLVSYWEHPFFFSCVRGDLPICKRQHQNFLSPNEIHWSEWQVLSLWSIEENQKYDQSKSEILNSSLIDKIKHK